MRIPASQRRNNSDWVLQFINIVFLMLLFFLANATIQSPLPQDIAPPVTILSETAAVPEGALYVSMTGEAIYRGQSLPENSFVALALDPPHVIFVDRQLPARKLIEIMAAIKAVGLPPIPIATVRPAK
jgi:biopolymer transport protein ExbD